MGLTEEQRKERRNDSHVKTLKEVICNKDSGKPYVFVSYKSDDWETVLQDVVYKLVEQHGLHVYYDGDFDKHNVSWLDQFRNNMGSDLCKGILVFRSPQYMTSYATVLELMYSQSRSFLLDNEVLPVICVKLEPNNSEGSDSKEPCNFWVDGTEKERESFEEVLIALTSSKNERQIDQAYRAKYNAYKRTKKNLGGLCVKIAEDLLSNTIYKDPEAIDDIKTTIEHACGKEVFDTKPPAAPVQAPAAATQTPDTPAPVAPASYTPPAADGYTYTLFGQTYHAGSREQGKLMYDTFAALAQYFPDQIPALTRRTSVARAQDVQDPNTRQAKPPYFRICRSFTVNGQEYLVGISYGFDAKLAEIRGMLKLCGVDPSEFVLIQGGTAPAAVSTPATQAPAAAPSSPAEGDTVFRYMLWGESCTADTLANLMHDVFDRIAARYPDKIPQMAADNSLSAVARQDDVDNNRLPAGKLNYFRAKRLHTVAGQAYYVSTRYGREQGIAQLEKMLRVCEGNANALVILSAPQKSVHNRSN